MINTQRIASVTETAKTLSVHMHTHEFHEIYYALHGDIEYHIEGRIYTLRPGDLILTKKGEAHSIIVNTQASYETLYVHFSDDAILGSVQEKTRIWKFLASKPLGMHNCYSASIFHNTNWMYYLKKIRTVSSESQKEFYLAVLLCELIEAYPQVSDPPTKSDQVINIIQYINDHLTEPLNLTQICKVFFISKAQLYRKFKQATGSSVWEYVIAKRLILAHEMLCSGISPTTTSIKSGFSDYSSFYRAYTSKFGVTPKEDYHRL